MWNRLKEDLKSFRTHDPAARSDLEIFFLYPGFKALRMHRKAQWLYQHKFYFLARWVSQRASRKTGIEIHPAAKIGRRVCIDHGSGVVIGETAEVGDDVMIYQGVTLGGTGKETGKRHPTLGNGVMVGSGARVLGPLTVGEHAKIAAGAVVLEDIPPHATAVGVPARVVKIAGTRVDDLDQVHIPDPVAQELCRLESQIISLTTQLKKLEDRQNESI